MKPGSIACAHRSSVPASLPTGGSANVDIKHFFNVLRGRSFYSDSMYLDVVEAGCEITRGNGWVATTWFSVDAQECGNSRV